MRTRQSVALSQSATAVQALGACLAQFRYAVELISPFAVLPTLRASADMTSAEIP